MDADAQHRMIMRVIDHYALTRASAADQEARAVMVGDSVRCAEFQAAAQAATEQADSIRVEVEQIIARLIAEAG